MNVPRPSPLTSAALVVPLALVLGAAGPAAAEPPSTPFGTHVSSCAQMSTGFSATHNPSHHLELHGTHDMSGMHC